MSMIRCDGCGSIVDSDADPAGFYDPLPHKLLKSSGFKCMSCRERDGDDEDTDLEVDDGDEEDEDDAD